MEQLDPALDERLEHGRPLQNSPSADLLSRRRSRRGKQLAASGVALAGAAAVFAASPVWSVGEAGRRSSSAGHPQVPAEIADAAGVQYVLPQEGPDGYRFFAANATAAADGTVDMRQVILAPRRLSDEPVVYLCVDASQEADRCPAGTVSVQREHNGLRVTINLRGPGATNAEAVWETVRLTTDAESSDVFE